MSDNANRSEDTSVTFNVKSSGGQKYTLTLPLSTTTIDLKNKLAGSEYANVPAESQRLIYSGKVLKDHETLATYNVKDGNTMHLVKSAASNQRQNPAAQSNTSSTGQTGSASVVPPTGVPQNLASGTGNDPLAGLTGARFAGFHGLPSLESLANPPTPEEMARRLQDPSFAQQMNEALQNPQVIDMMINMNPQLRAMGPQARQILQSDNFRRMMTNPEMLRSMMQMQTAMGGSPFGMGGGGQGAFPMPGSTNTTDQQHQAQGQGQDQNQQQQNQQNPFASLFGPGAPGMNPFLFNPAFQAPGGQNNPQDPASPNPQQQTPQANPFAALFNPAMMGQQPTAQQPGQTTESTNNSNTQQPPNPFANNPFLNQMYNNPEAMQNMMQMLGAGGAGGMDPFGLMGGGGGFGQPPDNRPPEERYATQLRQLNEMGFHDFDRNIQALTRSGGDVNGALEWLFSQT